MDFNRLQRWWNESDKTDKMLDDLIHSKIEIDGYTFRVSPGHHASLWASKNGKHINVWNIGAPDTQAEFFSMMRTQLNRATGGKPRKTRNQRKSRRGKSRKMRR